MEVSPVITSGELGQIIAVSAAIIVSLILGVRSLRQTGRIQANERKERLLNEIIEWAVNIYSCEYASSYETILDSKTADEQRRAIFAHVVKHKDRFQVMSERGQYVRTVAECKHFEENVLPAVEQALKDLKNYVEFMDSLQDKIAQCSHVDITQDVHTGSKNWNKLEKSVMKVMRVAARLKTVAIK